VATSLLDDLLTPDRELLTVITGAQATPDATAEVLSWIADNRPSVEVEVHDGGQPLYPYLFGAE
jgi:dihydroxyacetone kinase-like predicted kinase